MGQFGLLRARRFGPFFWTQFLGALNDNLFKNALVILFAFRMSGVAFSENTLVNLSTGLLTLPFFLFSASAGQIADKFDKSRIIRLVKLFEIGIMLLGAAGLRLHSVPLLLAVVFLMGTHSAVFGPVKYSILPQHLHADELVGGNALVQMGTFAAILLGTILGGALVKLGGETAVSATVLALAGAGWLASRGVPPAPAPAADLRFDWHPVRETLRIVGFARENRTVFLSILGISWFWFYGALFLAQFPGLTRHVLGGDEWVATLLLVVFSVGVALGCMLCERLSSRTVELGLVPFGSIGLSLFAADLFFATRGIAPAGAPVGPLAFLASLHHWRVLADLVLIGAFGGFFIVPLQALVQQRSEPSRRSRIIAANNILNAAFMVLAAVLGIVLRDAGLTIPELVLATAVVNAAVAVYIYTLIPEFLMRFLVWLLVHTVYRMRTRGMENLPEEGAAVLVSNHVSFVDALVILAASPRPIRFVMDHRIFKTPVLSFVFRTAKAIPIASAKEDERMLNAAYDSVAEALEHGELVAIFPEGRITDTGELYPFRGGIRRIVERTPVPVVPLALKGLWGSFFSRHGGAAMTRPFRRGVLSRIALEAAPAVPPGLATPESVQATVLAMRGDQR